jgi:hypothetical protein
MTTERTSTGLVLGYARVSTLDQNENLQKDALTDAGCDRIYMDKASGKLEPRPALDAMLDQLRADDTVVVWRLDRLGRSLRHLIEIFADLDNRGVSVRRAAVIVPNFPGRPMPPSLKRASGAEVGLSLSPRGRRHGRHRPCAARGNTSATRRTWPEPASVVVALAAVSLALQVVDEDDQAVAAGCGPRTRAIEGDHETPGVGVCRRVSEPCRVGIPPW